MKLLHQKKVLEPKNQRHHPDSKSGDLAQLVEHLLCKQGVRGSTPLVSTIGKDPLEIAGLFSLSEFIV